MEDKKKLGGELDKIKDNLAKSKTALANEQKQVASLTELLVATKDADAKAKLQASLDAANKKVKDLNKHITLGEKLVKTKSDKI